MNVYIFDFMCCFVFVVAEQFTGSRKKDPYKNPEDLIHKHGDEVCTKILSAVFKIDSSTDQHCKYIASLYFFLGYFVNLLLVLKGLLLLNVNPKSQL